MASDIIAKNACRGFRIAYHSHRRRFALSFGLPALTRDTVDTMAEGRRVRFARDAGESRSARVARERMREGKRTVGEDEDESAPGTRAHCFGDDAAGDLLTAVEEGLQVSDDGDGDADGEEVDAEDSDAFAADEVGDGDDGQDSRADALQNRLRRR